MRKGDFKGAAGIAAMMIGLVIALTTHILDYIVVPFALTVAGILIFLLVIAFFIYYRKYIEEHPYIPYAGKLAHILCRECEKRGRDYSIELMAGTAWESWSPNGRYGRRFERAFKARCNHGHEWTFDPILNRNERVKGEPRKHYMRNIKKIIEKSRLIREMFHKMYVEKPAIEPKSLEV